MSRILRADPYLTREDTGADKGRSPAVQHYEKQVGSDGSASNTVFTLSKPYVQGSNTLMVFINGQKAELLVTATDETEYEETSSSTITFGDSLQDTDVVEFMIVGTYFIQDTDIYVTKSLEKNSNLIINGDFRIAQRGTSTAAAPTGTSIADRIRYYKSGAMVHTVSQNSSPGLSFADAGRAVDYSIKLDCTTIDDAMAAGDYTAINYQVEGYDFAKVDGKYATLSFWVKSTKTGTFCVAFRDSAFSVSYVSEYTVSASDTWEKKTITLQFNEDAIGTWLHNNGSGVLLSFCIASGETSQTATTDAWHAGNYNSTANQVNACDSTDNNFELADIKLEEGQVATPFVPRPYAQELALCQRYYHTDVISTLATCYNPSYIRISPIFWKVTMRSAPTCAYSSVAWLPTAGGFGTIGAQYNTGSTDQFANPVWNTVTGTEGHCGQVTLTYTANAEI